LAQHERRHGILCSHVCEMSMHKKKFGLYTPLPILITPF
jgi:hypothetical protein